MVKYIGPKVKITRRLGILPGLTSKISKKEKTPGQHGKIFYNKSKRTSLSDDYKQRLIEKQKVRFNYGISEKQLLSYYKKAKKQKGSTSTILFQLLESRLDCLIYRLGFAKTISAARQLINHRHILVNQEIVSIPSFLCQPKDTISAKKKQKSQNLIKTTLEIIQLKRNLIIQRYNTLMTRKSKEGLKKNSNLKKIFKSSLFRTLLPNHLVLDFNNLKGKVLSQVNIQNRIIQVNDLKLIEYYSR